MFIESVLPPSEALKYDRLKKKIFKSFSLKVVTERVIARKMPTRDTYVAWLAWYAILRFLGSLKMQKYDIFPSLLPFRQTRLEVQGKKIR